MTINFYDKDGNFDFPEFDVVEILVDTEGQKLYFTKLNLNSDKVSRHCVDLRRFKVIL